MLQNVTLLYVKMVSCENKIFCDYYSSLDIKKLCLEGMAYFYEVNALTKQEKRKLPFNVYDDNGNVIEMPKKRERKPAKDGTNRGTEPIYITPEQWHVVESVAGIGGTDEEIGNAIGVSHWTLTDDYHNKFFQAVKKKGKHEGKTSLRRWQFQAAQKGNVSMLIFLGKNMLGQKDKSGFDFSGNFPVVLDDVRE